MPLQNAAANTGCIHLKNKSLYRHKKKSYGNNL